MQSMALEPEFITHMRGILRVVALRGIDFDEFIAYMRGISRVVARRGIGFDDPIIDAAWASIDATEPPRSLQEELDEFARQLDVQRMCGPVTPEEAALIQRIMSDVPPFSLDDDSADAFVAEIEAPAPPTAKLVDVVRPLASGRRRK